MYIYDQKERLGGVHQSVNSSFLWVMEFEVIFFKTIFFDFLQTMRRQRNEVVVELRKVSLINIVYFQV